MSSKMGIYITTSNLLNYLYHNGHILQRFFISNERCFGQVIFCLDFYGDITTWIIAFTYVNITLSGALLLLLVIPLQKNVFIKTEQLTVHCVVCYGVVRLQVKIPRRSKSTLGQSTVNTPLYKDVLIVNYIRVPMSANFLHTWSCYVSCFGISSTFGFNIIYDSFTVQKHISSIYIVNKFDMNSYSFVTDYFASVCKHFKRSCWSI